MLAVITLVMPSWPVLAFVLALLADWSLARPLEESKLWLLRRDDGEDWNEEKVVWLAGAAILVTLGIDSMLGARIRFGMLFRSISKSTKYKKIKWNTFSIKWKKKHWNIWYGTTWRWTLPPARFKKKNTLSFNTLTMKLSNSPHLYYLIQHVLIHPIHSGINT